MKKLIAIGVAAITAGAVEAGAQGVITEHLAAGIGALAAGVLAEFARRMPTAKDAKGNTTLASIVFVVAMTLPLAGCGLIEKATGFLGAQYAQWGDEAEFMFDLLCGRSESEARGRSFRGVEQDRSFIEDVCRSDEAIQTYGPLVAEALEQGQGRAMARARARAQ